MAPLLAVVAVMGGCERETPTRPEMGVGAPASLPQALTGPADPTALGAGDRRVLVCTRSRAGAAPVCDGWLVGTVRGDRLHSVARLQTGMNTISDLRARKLTAGDDPVEGGEFVPIADGPASCADLVVRDGSGREIVFLEAHLPTS